MLWNDPPPTLELPAISVHLWRVELNQPTAQIQKLRTLLADDEEIRRSRFHFQRDRDYFTVGRAALRLILARYLSLEPNELKFGYSTYGKPYISTAQNICFNVTHSAGLALYAFAQSRELGVDLERLRPLPDFEDIVRKFFTPQEIQMLESLSSKERERAFFQCWTRKEACIKATGNGLSQALDSFEVGFDGINRLNFGNDSRIWQVQNLEIGLGYVCAYAIEIEGAEVANWEWRP